MSGPSASSARRHTLPWRQKKTVDNKKTGCGKTEADLEDDDDQDDDQDDEVPPSPAAAAAAAAARSTDTPVVVAQSSSRPAKRRGGVADLDGGVDKQPRRQQQQQQRQSGKCVCHGGADREECEIVARIMQWPGVPGCEENLLRAKIQRVIHQVVNRCSEVNTKRLGVPGEFVWQPAGGGGGSGGGSAAVR